MPNIGADGKWFIIDQRISHIIAQIKEIEQVKFRKVRKTYITL